MPMPREGERAPEWTGPDEQGTTRSLADYKGRWLLLYFYPKDSTPGCTIEACTLRDQFQDFQSIGAEVVGVSPDSVASHLRFKEAYELPFTLIADTEKKIVAAYGVWGEKRMMGKTYMGTHRTSFLIDPEGIVRKVYEKVKPPVHAAEVIEDLHRLKG